jgi:rhodanese-related sulfurtransferase
MSTKSAGLAVLAGYTNVKVMLKGVPGWKKSGRAVVASDEFVNTGNIVLVDLRSAQKSAEGRIPRSVTIPYDTLDDVIDDIPVKAPVVLYSDSDEDVADALDDFKDEGYKKVSLVHGNFSGWIARGGKQTSGPIVTEINWQRILGKNEVSIPEFKQESLKNPLEVIILDVRTKDEAETGILRDAIHIPLDELGKKASMLDKNKEIFIHCTTGARAEMATNELKRMGFAKVRYLLAHITIEAGLCECTD